MYSEIFLVTCMTCVLKFLVLLFAALALGLLAGWWLWGKYKKMVDGLNSDVKKLKYKLNDREKEFASLKYAHDELVKDNGGMRASLAGCEGDRAALKASLNRSKIQLAAMSATAAAGAGVASMGVGIVPEREEEAPAVEIENSPIAMGSQADEDTGFAAYNRVFDRENLQIIEGVGPKISRTLYAAGIKNWGKLSKKSAPELETVLTEAGISIKINNPKTWSEQARLAEDSKWEELVKYQKSLDVGKDSQEEYDTPAKVEKLYLKAIGFAGAKSDDLKVVEGIGPKIEGLLKDGGIKNWTELADCKVNKIQDILTAAGSRYKLANPSTWPKQARFAANGQWNELKSYQDGLSGGR